MTANSVSIGILGATGYTGAELLRLLHDHPQARVTGMTAERYAGQPIEAVFPHLARRGLPTLIKIGDLNVGSLDIVFGCLPHGTTQDVIREMPRGPKVIDLSADFRLREPALYERTYGQPHRALERQEDAVYGLTELARDAIRATDLVANPGCYPTTAQLPLRPLLEAGLIELDPIVIDAKSGVSGAGRAAKEASLHAEVSEGLHAYGVGTHRHTPEIEQGLSDAAGRPVATIYVHLARGAQPAELQAELERRYADEAFVRVLPFQSLPATRHVRGTNLCLIAVHPGRLPGRAILLSVIDNLVKGASGQALQNMNVMLGLPETTGLDQVPMFP
jgi:N-acetyl-gamma-glutamyl-phosphate reductase